MTDLSQFTAQSLFNVKGWVAIVTGGGTGLGLMTANALAANGVKVYITGRRLEPLQKAEKHDSASGGSITAIQLDVTSKDSIKEFAKTFASKEKCLNLLVNNAGQTSKNYGTGHPDDDAFKPEGDPREVSERMLGVGDFDDWAGIYKVNVASIYFLSAAMLPLLCAARDHGYPEAGNILNISSISGITKTSQNGQFNYNAAKAATISLTEQLAVDLKNPGLEVRVNTLAPGYFPSEMTAVEQYLGKDKEFFRTRWMTPLGRAGAAEDYAQAVLSLAVNRFVTGATLVIDGGLLLASP